MYVKLLLFQKLLIIFPTGDNYCFRAIFMFLLFWWIFTYFLGWWIYHSHCGSLSATELFIDISLGQVRPVFIFLSGWSVRLSTSAGTVWTNDVPKNRGPKWLEHIISTCALVLPETFFINQNVFKCVFETKATISAQVGRGHPPISFGGWCLWPMSWKLILW